MIIRHAIENGLVSFHNAFDTWEEAVRASCKSLRDAQYIDEIYEDKIVANIYEHGPYIVIVPGIAMPHSTQGGEGVYKTGIAFMNVVSPVLFDEGDPTCSAQLFFTLAATDPDQHLENITSLMDVLMDESVVEALKKTRSLQDLIEVSNKYNI